MLPLQLFKSITIFLSQNVIVVFDLTKVVMYFVLFRQQNCQEKIFKKNLKDGSKVNYQFLSIRMQRKKDLVWQCIIEENLRDTYWRKRNLKIL